MLICNPSELYLLKSAKRFKNEKIYNFLFFMIRLNTFQGSVSLRNRDWNIAVLCVSPNNFVNSRDLVEPREVVANTS